VAGPERSFSWTRLAVAAAIALTAANCSGEPSRFSDRRGSPEVTGSFVNKSPSVQSRPLPPPGAHMTPPASRPAVTSTAGGSPGMVSYHPGPGHPSPAANPNDVTGTVRVAAPKPVTPPPAPRANWSWEGGTAITVAPGETAQSLSHRYGVPAAAIAEANGLPDAAAIKPGQRLVIPRSEVTGSVREPAPTRIASNMPPRVAAPAISAPATNTPAPIGNHAGSFVHTVGPGDTLMKLSRQYKKSLAELASANKIAPHTMVKVGDKIVIPGMRAVSVTPPVAHRLPTPAPTPAAPPPTKVVNAGPAPTARVVTPTADPPAEEKKPEAAGAMPAFRWPVRGKVIVGFGPKTTGQQNDGINVAVPEGTPIKAAGDGVVAYAGNELKTYGNLVLIRHANGYVTAYAHASEILVKRDETIKRGQVIAKAGQTGNVSTPQVHFEIRKGSAPVDPIPYLDKGGG
jgi:murein DD-endopeptidase MepM/ murein hydrolase activator NlpD